MLPAQIIERMKLGSNSLTTKYEGTLIYTNLVHVCTLLTPCPSTLYHGVVFLGTQRSRSCSWSWYASHSACSGSCCSCSSACVPALALAADAHPAAHASIQVGLREYSKEAAEQLAILNSVFLKVSLLCLSLPRCLFSLSLYVSLSCSPPLLQFDSLTELHGVYKVETIGEVYLVRTMLVLLLLLFMLLL